MRRQPAFMGKSLRQASQEADMRRLLMAIAVATVLTGTRVEAQNYPWCAQYSGSMAGATNCGFVSFDQCMNTVRGMGGFCQQNNTYVPPGGAAAQSSRARKPS
jgi:Protein of unknown function (DUF3551)